MLIHALVGVNGVLATVAEPRWWPTCLSTTVICLVVMLIHALVGVDGVHAPVAQPRWYVC